jgi:hypothetical protein
VLELGSARVAADLADDDAGAGFASLAACGVEWPRAGREQCDDGIAGA